MNSNISDPIPLNYIEHILEIGVTNVTLQANESSDENSATKYVDEVTSFYFEIIVNVVLTAIVSIIGIGANFINIIIFTRQGIFSDGGSPSLLCLAVSDLCCVTSMLWLSVNVAIVHADPPNLPWEPWGFLYMTSSWPHLMCAQITRMVTAYVAFERCICVVFPFKVKSLFTPRRSILVTAGIFLLVGLSHSPIYIMQQLEYRHDVSVNRSRLVIASSPLWKDTLDAMFYINSVMFNIGTVAIVLLCTIITVSRVRLSKAWRESFSANASTSNQNETKDQQEMQNKTSKSKFQKERKLVRMIISISAIFLFCYIPDFIFLLMFTVNSEIRVFGKYENLAAVMYSVTFFAETINSTINIIVYFKMSSRYKQDFSAMFGLKDLRT